MEHHHHATPTGLLIADLEPPAGQVSQLLNHENSLWRYNVATQSTCLSVAGILFLLRCYVRLGFSRMPRQWILEDWMVLASFSGLAIYSSLVILMTSREGGVHQYNLTSEQAHHVLYLFWIETIVYGPFIFCTKLSILLLYLRLLVPTRWSPLWSTIHVFIGVSASFYFAITCVKIWQCDPKAKAWDKLVVGHCINLPVLLQVSGLFNTISDALILLVPVRAVWNLRLSWKKKAGVCMIFGIGAVAPVFSAVGFYARLEAAPSKDFTYNDIVMLMWATAELTTGVICACLPTLPSLFRGPKPRKPSVTTSSHCRPTQFSGGRRSDPNADFEIISYVQLREMTREKRDPDLTEEMYVDEEIAMPKKAAVDGRVLGKISREALRRVKEREIDRDKITPDARRDHTQRGIVRTVRIEQTEG